VSAIVVLLEEVDVQEGDYYMMLKRKRGRVYHAGVTFVSKYAPVQFQ